MMHDIMTYVRLCWYEGARKSPRSRSNNMREKMNDVINCGNDEALAVNKKLLLTLSEYKLQHRQPIFLFFAFLPNNFALQQLYKTGHASQVTASTDTPLI